MNRITQKEDTYFYDEEKQKYYDKLKWYEDLEEQEKLLVMAYEICISNECKYCNHIEHRIEQTWVAPELLGHNGFYKSIEEANDELIKMDINNKNQIDTTKSKNKLRRNDTFIF